MATYGRARELSSRPNALVTRRLPRGSAEAIAQLVARGRPPLTNNAHDFMMWSVVATPCAERILDRRIRPLVGRHPPRQQHQVDTPERSRPLDSRQRAEGYARTGLIHGQELGAAWHVVRTAPDTFVRSPASGRRTGEFRACYSDRFSDQTRAFSAAAKVVHARYGSNSSAATRLTRAESAIVVAMATQSGTMTARPAAVLRRPKNAADQPTLSKSCMPHATSAASDDVFDARSRQAAPPSACR